MSTREKFLRKAFDQLERWNHELDELERDARASARDASNAAHKELAELRERRDRWQAEVERLQAASESAWEEVSDDLDASWKKLRDDLTRYRDRILANVKS